MTGAAMLMVAPAVWMISTAFKPEKEVLSAQPHWIPQTVTTENFAKLAERAEEFPIGRWFANSHFPICHRSHPIGHEHGGVRILST